MVRLVVVGHLALNEDRTPHGSRVSNGGSAYYCAKGAAVLGAAPVGVVAPVGPDYDDAGLRDLGVDRRGVKVVPHGRTPRFTIAQHPDGTRSFGADFGVADRPHLDAFPPAYRGARHVHLATAPPDQQLAWIRWLRTLSPRPTVSIDCFEQFVRDDPATTRLVCRDADLLFMNEEEHDRLGDGLGPAIVVTRGGHGAWFRSGDGDAGVDVPADPVDPVDTTGAGDLLAGVFLALRLAGIPAEAALPHAVAAASASVRDFGVDGARLAGTLARIRQSVTAG